MLSRRLILLASAVTVLVFPTPASAIVNGSPAAQGEYPAQGVLRIGRDEIPGFDDYCGGTLIGSRQFLTAATCVTDAFGADLPTENLLVRLGNVDRAPDPPDTPDDYAVASFTVAPGYTDTPKPTNDVAVLTLARVADYEPMRVVDASETDLWKPETLATVLGWGRISTAGIRPENLQAVDIPIVDDSRCSTAYAAAFKPALMVCAAAPQATPVGEGPDFCEDDEGGPLIVSDLSPIGAVAGIVSWHGTGAACADPAKPGVYTQIGDGELNEWVHSKTPEADFTLSHQPRVNEAVRLTQTARVPTGAPPFTIFRWDLDNDGAFDDATGASILHTYTQVGEAVAGLQASTTAGDKAVVYYAFDIQPNPNDVPPTQTPTGPTTIAPPATNPVASPPLATILNAKRPKVRRGRFPIRIRFAKAAPTGTAVIEVYRGTRRIGIARTRVRRGATKRVRVKLTPTGRRILRRADSKRLKIRVRVRVGRKLLRTKQLTIRR